MTETPQLLLDLLVRKFEAVDRDLGALDQKASGLFAGLTLVLALLVLAVDHSFSGLVRWIALCGAICHLASGIGLSLAALWPRSIRTYPVTQDSLAKTATLPSSQIIGFLAEALERDIEANLRQAERKARLVRLAMSSALVSVVWLMILICARAL